VAGVGEVTDGGGDELVDEGCVGDEGRPPQAARAKATMRVKVSAFIEIPPSDATIEHSNYW
jgi:hypothetical protein